LLHFEGGVEITHTVGNIFDTACEDIPVLDARNACELLCVRGKPRHVVLRLQLVSLACFYLILLLRSSSASGMYIICNLYT